MCVSPGSGVLKRARPKCTLCAPKEQLPAREKMVHDDTERPHIESGMRFDGALHQVYPIRLDALDERKLLRHTNDLLLVLAPPHCGALIGYLEPLGAELLPKFGCSHHRTEQEVHELGRTIGCAVLHARTCSKQTSGIQVDEFPRALDADQVARLEVAVCDSERVYVLNALR
jgi:hypothetical protein